MLKERATTSDAPVRELAVSQHILGMTGLDFSARENGPPSARENEPTPATMIPFSTLQLHGKRVFAVIRT